MDERDQYLAENILSHMSESQKQQLFDVIKNYNEVKSKLWPVHLTGEEIHMLPTVKISFGFFGHLPLGNSH